MRRMASLIALLAGAIALAPLSAAPPPPPPSKQPDIIVEGRLQSMLRNFIASLTQVGPTGQIAHWKNEVCPAVEGIAPAQAQFMEGRIVELAETVGLRKGGAGCVTTLGIIITPDPMGFADDLVRQYPVTLRAEGLSRVKSFAQTSRPVR